MSKVMVRYKVKPELADRNEELVRAVYAELVATTPNGIRYATFALEDGVSFVHVAWNDRVGDESPLMKVDAFRAFIDGVQDRCDEPPATYQLREIGSYRFWSD
jgi:hypothetical protein